MANDAFKTGESYTLAELFSKDHQIIIPDLQRDYCWGDSCHTEERKELVSGFARKLLELFQNNKVRHVRHELFLEGVHQRTRLKHKQRLRSFRHLQSITTWK